MGGCQHCGIVKKFYYVCPHCGLRLCGDHKKPASHSCIGMAKKAIKIGLDGMAFREVPNDSSIIHPRLRRLYQLDL